MSTTEARDALVATDPTRSYAVAHQTFYHRETKMVDHHYWISVFAENDEDLEQFSGRSIEEAFQQAIAHLHAAS